MLRPAYPIETPRLRLRPFGQDDLEALYEIRSRADVSRYLYTGPLSREEVRDALAERMRATAIAAEGDKLVLAVERRDSGALIGDVVLSWLSEQHEQGEIGFVLHPDHQGRGFATEAAVEMLRLGFDELGLHRIIGRCDARNDASARLMESLGMRREAHFRENEVVKGERCDEYVYALLAAEWAAARRAWHSGSRPASPGTDSG
jgi:RimJ/RimL family protein N-acetyltransferase